MKGSFHVKSQCLGSFLLEEERSQKQVCMLEFHPVTLVTQASGPAPYSVQCNGLLPPSSLRVRTCGPWVVGQFLHLVISISMFRKKQGVQKEE
jgi:hypothetical protein